MAVVINKSSVSKKLTDIVLKELSGVVGLEWVLTRQRDLAVYSYDGTPFRGLPWAVVLPENSQEVRDVVKTLTKHNLPIISRGAGTSLSGGPVPAKGGVVLPLTRMDRIIDIDTKNCWALVEAGVRNQRLQKALAPLGYWYPPDPASLSVSTIGGNVAENAGGPHCLKYGVTSNHVLGLEVVLPDGETIHTGSFASNRSGYDLTGLMIGSEGTMGVITKAMLRISPLPEATITTMALFESCWDAAVTVFEVIKAGLNPSVLEMLEEKMLREVNEVFDLGYPESSKALLIIEVDGNKEGLAAEAEAITDICRRNRVQFLKTAETEEEREKLWIARRGGTSALGRLKPDSAENDIVVPRSKLPYMVEKFKEISERHGVIMGALLHAGDGNCHPQVPFDAGIPEEKEAAELALWEVFQAAVEFGGSISGEHGVGLEKIRGMSLMFNQDEIALFRKIKLLFDPRDLFNPGKIFSDEIVASVEEGNIGICPAQLSKIAENDNLDQVVLSQVLGPKTADQAARILAEAAATGNTVAIVGGQSKFAPDKSFVSANWLLRTLGLRDEPEIKTDDLVVFVQAGVLLADLQRKLSSCGLFLPIDSEMPGATIGGIVSFGESEIIRDLVLGMKVALLDGKVYHFGGQTVKNVAGYDVGKLFIGSKGTLGVITDLCLRVYPLHKEKNEYLKLGTKSLPGNYGEKSLSPWDEKIKKFFDSKNLLNPGIRP